MDTTHALSCPAYLSCTWYTLTNTSLHSRSFWQYQFLKYYVYVCVCVCVGGGAHICMYMCFTGACHALYLKRGTYS